MWFGSDLAVQSTGSALLDEIVEEVRIVMPSSESFCKELML